jgi:hypothetical protein
VTNFNHLGKLPIFQNDIHEEIKIRLNSAKVSTILSRIFCLPVSCLTVSRKMYRTIILQFILCGYVILTLTWTEERVSSVFHYRLLGKIFGPKGGEVPRKWRRFHREDLHYRYSSSTKYLLSYKIKIRIKLPNLNFLF